MNMSIMDTPLIDNDTIRQTSINSTEGREVIAKRCVQMIKMHSINYPVIIITVCFSFREETIFIFV